MMFVETEGDKLSLILPACSEEYRIGSVLLNYCNRSPD